MDRQRHVRAGHGSVMAIRGRLWSVTAISGQAMGQSLPFRTGHGQSQPCQDRLWVSHGHLGQAMGQSWPFGAGHGQSWPFRAGCGSVTAIQDRT